MEPQDYVSGGGSTITRSWNRRTTSLDAGRPLQGRGTAGLRLLTRVDHYKVVEPLDYVSGRGSTTTRSCNRTSIRLQTRVDRCRVWTWFTTYLRQTEVRCNVVFQSRYTTMVCVRHHVNLNADRRVFKVHANTKLWNRERRTNSFSTSLSDFAANVALFIFE